MNVELIIGVATLVATLIGLLFFSLFPWIKKFLIKKAFFNIHNFYKNYALINPYLYNSDNIEEIITQDLRSQKILFYGFPKNWYLLLKINDNLNFLKDPINVWNERFSSIEAYQFYIFWRTLNKQLKNIIKILDKYEYIFIDDTNIKDNPIIQYNSVKGVEIEKTKIIFNPDFYNLKTNTKKSTSITKNSKKANLTKLIKANRKLTFINSLQKKHFYVNIKFKNSESYSYSIDFVNGKAVNYWKSKFNSNEQVCNSFNNECSKWIEEIFDVNEKENNCNI